jgi:hypothetical protein
MDFVLGLALVVGWVVLMEAVVYYSIKRRFTDDV